MKLIATIPVLVAVCLVSASAAQHATKPAPVVRPERSQPSPVRQDRPQIKDKQRSLSEGGPASPPNLEKLLKLTPEQRSRALRSLPPTRRAQIEAKLNDYQKMPPQQRARVLDRYQRFQTLPPEKQTQVRASLRMFKDLPQPRHQVVQKQLNQMRSLSDSDRRALMNSDEFRSKFTPSEQQMIEDISLIAPRN